MNICEQHYNNCIFHLGMRIFRSFMTWFLLTGLFFLQLPSTSGTRYLNICMIPLTFLRCIAPFFMVYRILVYILVVFSATVP